MTEKILTWDEKFAICDWSKKDSIVTLFPDYVQEQVRVSKQKNVSKAVNIELFTMKTPYGDQVLLKDTSLILQAGKRQALIGNNSTGKSLLFHNMIDGKIKDFPKHIHVHMCQELEGDELNDTVINTVVNSHPFRNVLLKVEPKLAEELAAAEAGDRKDSLKINLEWVQGQMRAISGYDAKERAEKMLRVLGFDEYGQAKLVSALSGGLRMRVALCMAFFINAELLLLDEPTNHLDFPSVLWLENRLRGYRGSFLMVSHDRELLNNVCTNILIIEDQKINYYDCGFKEFEKKKAAEDKKKFDEIEKFLHKNQNVDPSTFLGRQKADKKAWSEAYYQRQIAMAGKFTFPVATPLENTVKDENGNALPESEISLINLQNLRFSYDPKAEKPVFIFNDPIAFNVKASTRCGVMGPNGAGKSTLLKLLTYKLTATDGTVTHHPNYRLAYFGQHSTAELEPELTPAEFMVKHFPDETAGALRNHLQKTGIGGGVADTRMKALSYSQKSCVVFAKLTFVCPHLLILDEPTNFLDLASVDSLISACNKYKGALLLVSHNRDFLKKCATSFLSIVPGHFLSFNDLKSAENATYTFIAEMEEGNSSAAKSALANNPGGGSVHAAQVNGGKVEQKKASDGVLSISSSGASKPAAKKVAAPVVTYTVNEKVQALWTDGKWYAGVVKKVADAKGNYAVLYTAYGNTALLTPAQIKKAEAPAAAAAPKK
jgi:ATPase subunit of ABC transporter with duplicated ATPase domains